MYLVNMKPHVCIFSPDSEASMEVKELCSKGVECDFINISNNTTLKQVINLGIIHCVPTILQIDSTNEQMNIFHGKKECLQYLEDKFSLKKSKSSYNEVTSYQQAREIKGNIIPNSAMENKPQNTGKKISIMEQAKQMSADREQELKRIGPPPVGS